MSIGAFSDAASQARSASGNRPALWDDRRSSEKRAGGADSESIFPVAVV